MRRVALGLLLTSLVLSPGDVFSQTAPAQPSADAPSGPADLCHELLAYADQEAGTADARPSGTAPAPANAPAPRSDAQGTGTQGGGSVDQSSSTNTSEQESKPTTTPATTGAAPEAASSPHANSSGSNAPENQSNDAALSREQMRQAALSQDRRTCREMVQKLRRAGAKLPAGLIALAAYEPEAARR